MPQEHSLRRNCGADADQLTNSVSDAFHSADGELVDLFVYGTLLSDRHVKLLIGRQVETESAQLYHFMRVVPPGAFYFIVKQHGAITQGRILKHLTRQELAKVDAFEDEGSLYYRKQVIVRTADGSRRRCLTYVGNIPALQKSFGRDILFEDRYSLYLDKKIDTILEKIEPARHEVTRRALRELLGAEVDSLIESHFDGNYICNYIMVQSLSDAKPPLLVNVVSNPAIRPYADNYIKFACKHIIFNQFADMIRRRFPDSVRLSRKYYRHGLSILLAFMYYNRKKTEIEQLMSAYSLDHLIPGRLYRDYAIQCIKLVEQIYSDAEMLELIDYVDSNWYSSPTPLGAELEFSHLGVHAVDAQPGDDPVFDGFYWFDDFDLQRRTWRVGGHVDSHRNITPGMKRHRGFFEYALGRFNIVGDLSRPLFDCPWGMSRLINEAVQFLGEIPPHSLHISMELPERAKSMTMRQHKESDLACLLLLGGDIRKDESGHLREWRIFNNELDTNRMRSLNFSDRKEHYSRPEHEGASDVIEYKYIRLHPVETDYRSLIVALKGYQAASHGRPITIQRQGAGELPEQVFLREWAANPEPLSSSEIESFLSTVEAGLKVEHNSLQLDRRRRSAMEKLHLLLQMKNYELKNYRDEHG